MATVNRRIDMCNGPIFINAIRYTIPIILTGIMQLLFNAADLIVVGWFCGSNSVGAVGATNSIISLLVNSFIGIASGVSVVAANSIGARKDAETSRIVHTAIPLGFWAGVLLTVVGLFISTPMLRLMDTPDELLPLSSLYTRIYFCGMVPNLGFNFCAAILRATGDTKSPMKYLSIAGVLNVVLNVLFVTVFHMDVAGVALATIISQMVSFALALFALIRRDDSCALDFRKMRIESAALKKILLLGLPAGLQSSIFSISNVIIQSSINSFGAAAVAGNAAAANLEGFVYTSMNAFYHTSLNFTGQNIGARKLDRTRKTLIVCILSAVSIGAVLGFGFYQLSPQLLSFYIKDNPAAIACGIKRMCYICLSYFLCGIMECLVGALRGMGASLTSLVISVLGVCGFRLGWIFTIFRIEKFHTLESLYFSYIISWSMCIIVQVIVFTVLFKKEKQKCIAE